MAIYFENVQGDVASIFLSYFQRAPEFEAMQHYVGVLQALQANPQTADNAFNLLAAHIYADGVASQEVPAGPTVTDAWYVSYLYSNVLGRAPDAEGLAYWVAELEAGNIARAELVGTFVAAALASEGRDAAYLENRTEVAVEFAQWENSNPQVLPTLKYNAAEVLLGVNEDPATVAIAESRLETTTGVVGETRNLTTDIDTIEGTTGNDTFNAVFEGTGLSADSTLTAFDSIDGDLGTDTLNIYVAGAGGANAGFPSSATVRNVEVVNVFNGSVADASLRTVSNYQGVEQFWQITSAGDVTAVGAGTAVGFRAIDDLDVSVTLAANVTTATIALDGVGKTDADLQTIGASTVNVVGTQHASADPLELEVQAAKGVTAITVNTDVDTMVELSRADLVETVRVNTIDFSGSTGDVWFGVLGDTANSVVGEAAALSVTFGSGDDLIGFSADFRNLTLRDNIDGGEGYNTIALDIDGKLQTQTYDSIARLENFQQIGFVGEDVEVDAAQLGDLDLQLAGDGSAIVSNLADGQSFVVAGDELGDVTLNKAGANVTIELGSEFFDESVNFELFVGADSNLGATGGTLTLVGAPADEEAFFFNYDNASGKFSTFDATALEGSMNIWGLKAGVVETIIFGEASAGHIALTLEESTLGNTDVVFGYNIDAEAGPTSILLIEGQVGVAEAKDYSSQGSLNEALAAAAALDTGADELVVFLFGGDTYVYADNVGTGLNQYDNSDFLIKLAGFADYDGLAEQLGFVVEV